MAVTQSITCDICNKKKEQVNHWWKFWVRNDRFAATKAENFVGDDPKNPIHDACSETCAAIAFTRWMCNGTFEVPKRVKEAIQALG